MLTEEGYLGLEPGESTRVPKSSPLNIGSAPPVIVLAYLGPYVRKRS